MTNVLAFWIFGSIGLFTIFVSFAVIMPAFDTITSVMNTTGNDMLTGNDQGNFTRILNFTHLMFSFVPLVLVVVLIVIIYLASVSREPQSQVFVGG